MKPTFNPKRARVLCAAAAAACLVLVGCGVALGAEAPPAPAITVAAYDLESDAFVVLTGDERRLTRVRRLTDVGAAALSADGRTLAYVRFTRGRHEIRVAPSASSASRLLATAPRTSRFAVGISPDGTTVVAAVRDRIEVFRDARRRIVALPRAWRGSRYEGLAVAPTATQVAVLRQWGSGRAGTLRGELALVPLEGGAPRVLYRVRDPSIEAPLPAFSRDGNLVAFTAAPRPMTQSESVVWIADVSTGRARQLTYPRGSALDERPVISPDGSSVAFARRPNYGTNDVWIAAVRSRAARRLTTTPIRSEGEGTVPLAWSPDGTRLLVLRNFDLEIVDVATGARTRVARVGEVYPEAAAWAAR